MDKIRKLIFLILIFALSLCANEQQILKRNFLNKIDEVITVVTDKSISKEIRNDRIVSVLTPMFDFELMAKLSLGSTWKTLDDQTSNKFVNLYVNRMKQSYSSKIDAYSDEKVEVTKINQPKSNRIEFETNLVSKVNKLEIVYKFYKPNQLKLDKNDWLIYDVEILGVSILKTDIAQFREFLKTNTIEQLMEKM